MKALLLAGAVALAWASVTQAAVYDAVADFSTASNPNGVWSYGYGTAGVGGLSFTAFTTANSSFGSPAWNLPGLPLVGQAYTGGTVAVPASDLWLHPGNADDLSAIVRFTAPVSGVYDLSAVWERADAANGSGNGTNVFLYQNNNRQTGSFLAALTGASFATSLTATLAANDTLSFVVDRNGEYTFDSTGLRATISSDTAGTSVPEPASFALLGLGVTGLAALRRRRAG